MILAVLAIGFLLLWTTHLMFQRLHGKLPPGPRGLPIIGNIFQIPTFQFLRFSEWKKEFGPLFSLNLAGQTVVVINSLDVAVDIMEHRSRIYSDRPRLIVGNELLTGQLMLVLVSYGELWRKLRKAAHEGLRSQVVPTYQPGQELEAAILAENLIKNPMSWAEEIKRSTASSMKSFVYGTPVDSASDPVVDYINDWGHRLTSTLLPGAYLVELFPKMMYLPTWLAPWKRDAMEWFKKDNQELQKILQPIKEQVVNGSYDRPSFATNLCLAEDRHHLTQEEEAWLAGTMFVAGVDTSSAAFRFFILAMRLYPEVMKKAQAELDKVIGRERAPTFSDKENLPYIRAMVKEVLRWGPVAPLGVPHQAQEDDYYGGCLIPKGAIIMVNGWEIHHNPEIYPNPYEFRPERFLDPTGTIDVVPPGTRDYGHVTFGFGRRICVGSEVAVQFLFINIATLLWATTIEPAPDDDGQVRAPSNSSAWWVDEGTILRPVPFDCKILPRFSNVDAILRRAKEQYAD